ncbi:MAG TPA: hypothetical protein VGS19_22325, partial [Streptosporangiaceae bacterium]|nr:hypothetical protein [Streptosporangiaceae bacterium]
GGGGPTGLPGGPAVFNPGGDDLEVYGVGADHSLQEAYYKNGAWHSNTTLGGSVTGTPSAVYDIASGNLEVYATGTDGTVQEDYWSPKSGAWAGWRQLLPAMAVVGSPAVVYNPGGKDLEVYARAKTSGNLVEDYWNSTGWHAGAPLKQAITSDPAAVYNPGGKDIEVYAAGTSATLVEQYWNAKGWHIGTPPKETMTGIPSAVYNPIGKDLEVYTAGTPGSAGAPLHEVYWNGNWHTSTNLPATLISGSPSAAYDNEGGTLEVYAKGGPASSGAGAPLVEVYWNGTDWHTSTNLPAWTAMGRPAPVYDNEGDTFEVYDIPPPASGATGSPLQEVWWDPNGWHGPQTVLTANLISP